MMEGRQLAETMQGPEKQYLLSVCDNVQRLSKELADLKARGLVSVDEKHLDYHAFFYYRPWLIVVFGMFCYSL